MKEEFLKLKNKYWHPSLSDWDILHFKTKDGEEIFIYMHNATVSEDGSTLMLKGCYRNFSFDELAEIDSTIGSPWSER